MTTALNIFRSLCTVLIGKHNSNAVLIHLKAKKDFIKECRITDMEEGDKLGDSPLTQEEDDEERRNAHTIVGRSPFTYEFRKVMEEVMECYIRGILNLKDNAGRLYLLDHYTMGVILHGTREQRTRQELQKVTFDLYDGAIGFVNIRNVHWKFVVSTRVVIL
ncbi:hypothetical protein KUCAC02_021769 [Chaenocephalus aceratus]|uniref:Uncharacterized protein n=1 Tax=Chaenocephalus aceratus TaxID=36190 RepID=A0ACB9XHR0_CHAAC|nr:hypothetical protein KUCAC02_021769 [Chaenocephalus aceratus]